MSFHLPRSAFAVFRVPFRRSVFSASYGRVRVSEAAGTLLATNWSEVRGNKTVFPRFSSHLPRDCEGTPLYEGRQNYRVCKKCNSLREDRQAWVVPTICCVRTVGQQFPPTPRYALI